MFEISKKNKLILSYVFIQLFVFHVAQYLIGPLIPLISKDLDVSLDILGTVVSLSMIGLIISSFLSGNIIERFGYKSILVVSLFLGLISCFGIFFSKNIIIFIIFYILLQTIAGIIIGCSISLTGYISGDNKTINLIVVMIGAAMSNFISPLIVSFTLLKDINWRLLFFYLIVPQLLLLIWLFFLRSPESIKKIKNLKCLFKSNRRILSNGLIIVDSFLVFFNMAVIFTFYTWFTLYFDAMGIRIIISSFYLSVFGLSLVMGSILKIYLLKVLSEINLLIISLVASIVFLVALYLSNNLFLIVLFVFLFGLSVCSNNMIVMSLGMKVFEKYEKTVSGFLLGASFLGVMVFQYLVGFFSEYYSSNSVIYIDMILLTISISLVIFLKFIEIKKSYPRRRDI
jgi:MFS transporter, DHA1 family, purine base/nucleoside efflux pump